MTNEHSSVLIHAQNLNKTCTIGDASINILANANFKVYSGEYVAMTGMYGRTRDAFINILGCIHKADTGKYYFDYDDICCANEGRLGEIRNEKIGFIFPDFKLIDHLSIIENVALPQKYAKTSVVVKHNKAKEVLAKLDFRGDIYSKPNETPDCEKQKAAIARALVNEPLLLIADEPTYNLDADSAKKIFEIFNNLNKEGTTITIISSQKEIMNHAHRVLSFSDGALVLDSCNNIHNFKERTVL